MYRQVRGRGGGGGEHAALSEESQGLTSSVLPRPLFNFTLSPLNIL